MGSIRQWLQHPDGRVTVVVHDDTLKRCLEEGWTPVAAPAATPEPVQDESIQIATRKRARNGR